MSELHLGQMYPAVHIPQLEPLLQGIELILEGQHAILVSLQEVKENQMSLESAIAEVRSSLSTQVGALRQRIQELKDAAEAALAAESNAEAERDALAAAAAAAEQQLNELDAAVDSVSTDVEAQAPPVEEPPVEEPPVEEPPVEEPPVEEPTPDQPAPEDNPPFQ